MYSCHLFLISYASVRSITFLSFIEPIFAWNIPLVSLILLKRSLSFPFYCLPLFLCIDHLESVSYLSACSSLKLHLDGCIFPFFLCLLLLFFSQLFVRPPQTTILPFCIFSSWGWFWSLPSVQYYEHPSIVHIKTISTHEFGSGVGHTIHSSKRNKSKQEMIFPVPVAHLHCRRLKHDFWMLSLYCRGA